MSFVAQLRKAYYIPFLFATYTILLTDPPEAINAIYPKTLVQCCIVHMVRNSTKYVSYKDLREVTKDLKAIYNSNTEKEALTALDTFSDKWDKKYPQYCLSN